MSARMDCAIMPTPFACIEVDTRVENANSGIIRITSSCIMRKRASLSILTKRVQREPRITHLHLGGLKSSPQGVARLAVIRMWHQRGAVHLYDGAAMRWNAGARTTGATDHLWTSRKNAEGKVVRQCHAVM